MSDPAGGEGEGRAAEEARPSLQRLDPDLRRGHPRRPPRRARRCRRRAADAPAADAPGAARRAHRRQPRRAPVIDTRPYRWMVGIIGLVVVLGISVYQFASHGVGNPTGVAAGHRLRYFAAPLAATNLNGDANDHPTCSAARHDPRALNVCLMARRGPLVLSFFVTGASQCVRQVSALQTLARPLPVAPVRRGGRSARSHTGDRGAGPGTPLDDPGGL